MVEIVLCRFSSRAKFEREMAARPEAVFVQLRAGWLKCGIGRGEVWLDAPFEIVMLVMALLRRPGGLSIGDAVDLLWGDARDGGPLSAENAAHQYLRDAKATLAALGFAMVREPGERRRRTAELGGDAQARAPARNAAKESLAASA